MKDIDVVLITESKWFLAAFTMKLRIVLILVIVTIAHVLILATLQRF